MKEAGKGGVRAVAATAALGGTLALAIELAQLAIPGRVADMTSVVLAVVGSATGGAVVRRPQRPPRQWVGPALVVWALAVALAAWTPPHPAAARRAGRCRRGSSYRFGPTTGVPTCTRWPTC